LTLARKSAQIRRNLGGCSMRARRTYDQSRAAEHARKMREREAASGKVPEHAEMAEVDNLKAALDECMNDLDAAQRDLIVQRHLMGRTLELIASRSRSFGDGRASAPRDRDVGVAREVARKGSPTAALLPLGGIRSRKRLPPNYRSK